MREDGSPQVPALDARSRATVIVLGISGVGKSWMCSRFAARTGWVHASASAILREARRVASDGPTDAEGLRTGPVLDNQGLLVDAFADMRARERGSIVLDAHNVVDDGRGLVRIPTGVFRDLAPDAFVFVASDPGTILARRAGDAARVRPARTADVLAEHQEAALAAARSDAGTLGVPLRVIRAGDEDAFASAVLGEDAEGSTVPA